MHVIMPVHFVAKLKLKLSHHPASGPPQLSKRGCAYANDDRLSPNERGKGHVNLFLMLPQSSL